MRRISLRPASAREHRVQPLLRPSIDDGSTPTVGSNYSVTRATKPFCLKLGEFHLLVVDLPCNYCQKHFNTRFILKHPNRCARDIVAI